MVDGKPAYATPTPAGAKIRILVADDHPVVRLGLRTLIEGEPDLEVVGEAYDGPSAVAAFAQLRPDVTLLDLRMPGLAGAEVITEIRRGTPNANIIVVTTYDADEDVFRAVRAGARGYLLKETFGEGLLEAIRSVHAGRRLIDPEVAARVLERMNAPAITARERDVLELVARGMSNREIGAALSMGEETVKAHLKHVFVKLEVKDRTGAALVALQRGLIKAS
jgi:two-component system NarL family response regulator